MSVRAGLAAWAWDWIKSIVIALAIWLVLRTFFFQAFRIISPSMVHTMEVGDWLFVNRALYGAEIPLLHRRLPVIREPRRGDIVVFDSKLEPITLVKRLIGVPGDTLAMHGGRLVRNGRPVDEPYVYHADITRSADSAYRTQMRAAQLPHYVGASAGAYHPDIQEWGPLVVPADSLFFMGDNRDDSYDSRYWGVQARNRVQGHASFVYYSYDPDSWRALPFLTAIRWSRIGMALR